ncbi:MAG: hypothetical protein CK519_02705 [Opitutia bacterium]|nr:MAG: hypothetical protein CK519_02705 [Opitutae bacterium]
MIIISVATGALGMISIMKLRLRSDDVGVRIVRLERSIADAKKELDALKRQRDISQDTVKLSEKAGEKFKLPKPEQVTWLRVSGPTLPTTSARTTPSPRVAALDLTFRPPAEMGGPRSR